MRSFLVTLLIVIFSGVHTTAASGAAPMDPSGMEHVTANNHDQIEAADNAHSHQMKCCEKTSDTNSDTDLSDCGADCVSFVVSSMTVLLISSLSPEHNRIPLLFAIASLPQDQPPKGV